MEGDPPATRSDEATRGLGPVGAGWSISRTDWALTAAGSGRTTPSVGFELSTPAIIDRSIRISPGMRVSIIGLGPFEPSRVGSPTGGIVVNNYHKIIYNELSRPVGKSGTG
jgi:hypothetical protein